MNNPVGHCQGCKKIVYAKDAKFKDKNGIVEKVWHNNCLNKLEQIFLGFNYIVGLTNLDDVIERMNHPNWHIEKHIHDWEGYIPKEWQKIWNSLPIEAKLVAFLMSENQASKEEWE